jgi:hypothetical protein
MSVHCRDDQPYHGNAADVRSTTSSDTDEQSSSRLPLHLRSTGTPSRRKSIMALTVGYVPHRTIRYSRSYVSVLRIDAKIRIAMTSFADRGSYFLN